MYIGSSINIKSRLQDHKRSLRSKTHRNKYLQRSWDKYGELNFEFLIVEKVISGVLFDREQYYIDLYNSANPNFGYNLHPSAYGPRGYKWSIESKLKQSESKKGCVILQSTRLKISESLKGRIKTPEEIYKLHLANKGKIIPESQRKKISDKLKGRVISEETKLKMSMSRIGKPYTRINSAETIKRMSDASRKVWSNPEHKAKMCEMRKGKMQSEETKSKRATTMRGKWKDPDYVAKILAARSTPEVRAKLSAARKGKPGSNLGRTFSEESRKKMSESAKRRCQRKLQSEI